MDRELYEPESRYESRGKEKILFSCRSWNLDSSDAQPLA